MRNRKGFTLIELLVVILIIGILLALIVPNFVLFQERARRTSVKNNMHVIQTALEAWAVDHYGNFPNADAEPFGDPEGYPDDGYIACYFPGGDPFGASGSPIPGRFPTNPYTGAMYDAGGGENDLVYGDNYDATGNVSMPGDCSCNNADDPSGATCPYEGATAPNDLQGSIGICTYIDPTTELVQEYGIAGYGKDIVYAMWDHANVSGSDVHLYFILHD